MISTKVKVPAIASDIDRVDGVIYSYSGDELRGSSSAIRLSEKSSPRSGWHDEKVKIPFVFLTNVVSKRRNVYRTRKKRLNS